MKNKFYLIYIILISVFLLDIVSASSILNYENISDYYSDIELSTKDIITNKEGYIILSETLNGSTSLLLYNNDNNLITSKVLSDLVSPSIIKYNDNYLVTGISSNVLKLYLLDNNLQVISQKETTYMISDKTKKLYLYDNKIYLMITSENTLYDNNIYEIDENLNIIQNNFSSYDVTILKSIFKGDYYLIKNNDIEENSRITHYYDSTYTKDYYILVGNTHNITADSIANNCNEKSILTILDSSGTELINKEIPDYYIFNKVFSIKDKIVIFASRWETSYLLTYDYSGNLLDEIILPNHFEDSIIKQINAIKVNNRLIIYSKKENEATNIRASYSFECNIYQEDNPYGTLEVADASLPNEETTIAITPNSGYEIENIDIRDAQGNQIELTENTFIMPENDVYINVSYTASVENPETVDMILMIGVTLVIIVGAIFAFREKLNWLN